MNIGHETTGDTFVIERSDDSAKQFNTNSTYYLSSPIFDDKTERNLHFEKAFESCNSDNNNMTSRRASQCMRGRGYEFIGRKLRQSVAIKRLSVSNQSSEYLDAIDFEDEIVPSKSGSNFEDSSKKLSFSSTKHRKDSDNDSRFNLDEDSVGSFRRRSYTSSYTRTTEILKETDGVTKKPNIENGLDFANEVLKVLDPPPNLPNIKDIDETSKLGDSYTRKSYKPLSFSETTTTTRRKSDFETNNFESKDKLKTPKEHGEDNIKVFPPDKKKQESINNKSPRDNGNRVSKNLSQSEIYNLYSYVTNEKPEAIEGVEIMKMLKKLLEEIEKISKYPKVCQYKPTEDKNNNPGELKTGAKSGKDGKDGRDHLQKPKDSSQKSNPNYGHSKNAPLSAGLNDDRNSDFRTMLGLGKNQQMGYEKLNSFLNSTDPNSTNSLQGFTFDNHKIEVKKNYITNEEYQAKYQNPDLTSNTAHGANADHPNFSGGTFSNDNKDKPIGYEQRTSIINNTDQNSTYSLQGLTFDNQKSELKKNYITNEEFQAKSQNPNLTSNIAHGINADHPNFSGGTFSKDNKDHGQMSKETLGHCQNGPTINNRDFNNPNHLATFNPDTHSILSEKFYLNTIEVSTLPDTGVTGDARINNLDFLDKFGIQGPNNDGSGKQSLNALSNFPNYLNQLNTGDPRINNGETLDRLGIQRTNYDLSGKPSPNTISNLPNYLSQLNTGDPRMNNGEILDRFGIQRTNYDLPGKQSLNTISNLPNYLNQLNTGDPRMNNGEILDRFGIQRTNYDLPGKQSLNTFSNLPNYINQLGSRDPRMNNGEILDRFGIQRTNYDLSGKPSLNTLSNLPNYINQLGSRDPRMNNGEILDRFGIQRANDDVSGKQSLQTFSNLPNYLNQLNTGDPRMNNGEILDRFGIHRTDNDLPGKPSLNTLSNLPNYVNQLDPGDPKMNNLELLDRLGIQRPNNDLLGKQSINTLSNLPTYLNQLNAGGKQELISKLLQSPGLSQLDPQTVLEINKLIDNKNLFYENSLKDIPLSFLINYLEEKLSHARNLGSALPKEGQSRFRTDISMGNERNRFYSRYDDIPGLRIRDRIPRVSKRSIAENNEYLRRLMNCRKSETRLSPKFPDQKSKDRKVEFKGTPDDLSKEYLLKTYNSGVQTDYDNSPRLTKAAYSQCTEDSLSNPKCSDLNDKSFDQSFQKCTIQSSEVISPTSPCSCHCRIHPHKRSNHSCSKYSSKEHKAFEITCPKHEDDDDDTEQLMLLCRKYLDKKQCGLSHKTSDCSAKHSDTYCQSENFRILDKLNNQIPVITPSIPNIPSIDTHNCSPIHMDNKCPAYSNSLLFSNSQSVRDCSNKYSDMYRYPHQTFMNPCHKYYHRNDKSPASFSSNCYGNNDNKSRHAMNNYDSDKLPNKTLYLRSLQNNLSRSLRSPYHQENLLEGYFNKFPLKRNNCANVDDISASYKSSETNGEKRREFLQTSFNKDIPKLPNREMKNKTYYEYVRCNDIRNQQKNDYPLRTPMPHERVLNQEFKVPQFDDNKKFYNKENVTRCSPDSVKINKCCSTSLEDVSKQSLPPSRKLLFKRSKNMVNNQRHMYNRLEDCHNIKSRNFSKALSNESSPISSDNSVTRKGYFVNQNFINFLKDGRKKCDKIIQTQNPKEEEVTSKLNKSNEERINNYSTGIRNKIPDVQQPVKEIRVNMNKQLLSEEAHIPVIVKQREFKNIHSDNYLKKPESFKTKNVNSINVSLSENLRSHDWSTLSHKENAHEYVQFQDASSSLVTQLPAKNHQSNYLKTFVHEGTKPRLDSNKCFSNVHNTSGAKVLIDSKLLNQQKHRDINSQSRDNQESLGEEPKKPQELLNLSERVLSKSNKSQGTQFSEYSTNNLLCQSFVRKKSANNIKRISNLYKSQCDNSYPHHSGNAFSRLQKVKRSFFYSGKIPPMYNQRKIGKPILPDSKHLEILTTLEKDISLNSTSIARRVSMATQTLSLSECSLSQSDISYCSEMISTSSDDNYCFPCDPRYDLYE